MTYDSPYFTNDNSNYQIKIDDIAETPFGEQPVDPIISYLWRDTVQQCNDQQIGIIFGINDGVLSLAPPNGAPVGSDPGLPNFQQFPGIMHQYGWSRALKEALERGEDLEFVSGPTFNMYYQGNDYPDSAVTDDGPEVLPNTYNAPFRNNVQYFA